MSDNLDRLKTALPDRYARDLRYALRVLRRNPVFTTVAVVTLALGVGPNTAIYSVLHGVVLKPLPYPEYDRLVSIGHWASAVNTASGPLGMTPGLFVHYRGLNRTLEGIAMFRGLAFRLTEDGEPEDLGVVETTVELSAILRVSPLVGRWFNQEDVTSERDVVVLSHELWVQRYGADSAIVGRTIRLNDKAYEVVGIMPQDFSFPWKTPLWTLYKIQGTAPFRAAQPFGAFRFGAVARLKLDVSLAEVEADLEALIPSVHDAFPGAFARFVVEEARLRPDVVPLKNSDVQDVQHTLWLLVGTAGFVLLIACANAGNLFLVRAHVRQREVAVRAALGAGRGDLVRSFLMESTLLALFGGMLGLAAAFGGVRALVSVAPSSIPRLSEIGIDGSVLLFTAAISLLTGILFGVIPIPTSAAEYRLGAQGTRRRVDNRPISISSEARPGRRPDVLGPGAVDRGWPHDPELLAPESRGSGF